MRPIAATLAGAGAALAASLVFWPVYVAVANAPGVRDLDLGAAATEVIWGVPFGAAAGLAAARIAGLVSQRAWTIGAFGPWLIWTAVLALLLGLGTVPPVFVLTATLVALGMTAVLAARSRRHVATGPVRALLAGAGGFGVFVIAFVLVIVAASRSRPGGVGFADWRRYMDVIDVFGLIAVLIGAGAALALVFVTSGRGIAGVFVSLLAFGVLFVAATPMLGLLSACYAGEVVRIVGWLVSPTC